MAAVRPRRLGVWALAFVSVAAGLIFLAWRAFGGADGGLIPFYGDSWQTNGVGVEAVDAATELRTGDVVTTIAGRSVSDWIDASLDPTLDRSALTAADPIAYAVIRYGTGQALSVEYATRDVGGVLADNWANLLFAAVMLGVGLYVLWRRPELSASVALAIAGCGVAGSILPWLLGIQTSDIAFGWPFLVYVLGASLIYMLLWPAGALHLPLALAGNPSRRTLVLVYAIPLGGYGLALLAARLMTPSSTAWLGTWPAIQLFVAIPSVLVGLLLAAPAIRRCLVGHAPPGALGYRRRHPCHCRQPIRCSSCRS